MKFRKFALRGKEIFINPELVTAVTKTEKTEDQSFIYFGEDFFRVDGKAEDIIFELTGQRF